MTRREWLALAGAAAGIRGNLGATPKSAPAPPVSIARCRSYNEDIAAILARMFDQLGGLPRLVRNKTVTIKLNLTGSPGLRFQGKPLGATHYTHPKTVAALAHLMGEAGARRIRFVESCWGTSGPLEEYMLDSGWSVRTLKNVAPNVEFENTNARGAGTKYARLKVPGGGSIFPAYDLNHSYEDTDVFVSMAKLKEHGTCGVTLSLKNIFGITPASIYGDDAGKDEPNENPGQGRVNVCHIGKRQPARCSPGEIQPSSSRDPGYRMPRIVADLASARPIDIAFIDGVETLAGGEGPWIKGVRAVQPGVLILGTNAVTVDTAATAVMGFDPRATRGAAPFRNCDNTLLLSEALGLGSAHLDRIDIRGLQLAEARLKF